MKKLFYLLVICLLCLVSNSFCQNLETIKIGNLEIMKEDVGNLDWFEAKKTCTNIGSGWRLPTMDELNVLFKNKEKIGGFKKDALYWSSNEAPSVDKGDEIGNAWIIFFENGMRATFFKYGYAHIRPVKTVK